MKNLSIIIYLSFLIFVFGCGTHKPENNEHETPSVSVTQWTDKMEIFMEYEIPVKSNPVKFIVHLTKLKDFKAITGGELTLVFAHENGERIQIKENNLLREGIFTPSTTFELTGKFNFTIDYNSKDVTEHFDIGEIVVYQSQDEIPVEEESEDEGISFLKEQQWKTEFRTEPARNLKIHCAIIAMGEVLPKQQSYVEIISPTDGVLNVQHNNNMVNPGTLMKKGQQALVLSPPLNATNSWIEWVLEYERSKSEFDRAEKLLTKQSISVGDYEKIKYNYLIQKAKYKSFLIDEAAEKQINFDLEKNTLKINAPIDGIVTDIMVYPGQKVSAGQKLMTIINPDMVWIKINLFEKDYYKIDKLQGLSLIIPGLDSLIVFDRKSLNVLNTGNVIDAQTRSIPVLVELKNPAGILKIGQVLQVELYTSEQKDELCVPKHAVYDDDGKQVIFVHTEGETFEKRSVVTGGSYQGWVAILSGIKDGERVVTEGGYQIKLASTSAAIGHPHTH